MNLSQFAKSASPDPHQLLLNEANRDIYKVLLSSLAVGGAARGAIGLGQLMNKNLTRKPVRVAGPVVTPIEIPIDKEEDKTAEEQLWLKPLSGKGYLTGANATSKSGIPAYLPLAAGGVALGLAGGWKAVDSVLDRRRKAQQKAELEKAREMFHKALVVDPQSKVATVLEEMCDMLEKVANVPQTMFKNDLTGKTLGLYLMYALGAGAMGAHMGYNVGKKRQQRQILDKAQRNRIIEQSAKRPNEIYAVPTYRATSPLSAIKQDANDLEELTGAADLANV